MEQTHNKKTSKPYSPEFRERAVRFHSCIRNTFSSCQTMDRNTFMEDAGVALRNFSIRLDPDLVARIDGTGAKRSEFVRDAIDVHLAREAQILDGEPYDIPFAEPERPSQEPVGPGAGGAGRSGPDAGEPRVSDARSGGDRGAISEATAAGDQRLIEGIAPPSADLGPDTDDDFTFEVDMLDGSVRTMSATDLLDYFDQVENFLARLDLCGKGPA